MEFQLCTILLVMGSILEGGCALGIGGHTGMLRKNRQRGTSLEELTRSYVSNSGSYQAYNYTQILDHFGYTPESYQTFPQRYFMKKSNWGGAQNNSPIFVWLGAEGDITSDLGVGILVDQAPNFKALVVYIEHHLKKTLTAENCPVVVFGGSYGGMLAAWFRLKYPHLTIGALAFSAPILYFDDITPTFGYGSVVTKDFRNVSEICYRRINESWAMMDKIASSPQGLLNLSKLFNTCENITDKEAFYDVLELMYDGAAQYDFVQVEGVNTLPKPSQCHTDFIASLTWLYCGTTMLRPSLFDIKSYARDCYLQYGVLPRQHWATTQFGGHDIKRVLKDFGSNIIFSNGLRDPYSSGGVLFNISESIVALVTEEGTHCEDVVYLSASEHPVWLKEQRLKEIMIIRKWINDYKFSL
ncbi:hypothetical protein SUGI_0994150 [Cryptomeria japonica]|nr:hypothetical protein SUGI_0994150 [Cryptomeria japonica]